MTREPIKLQAIYDQEVFEIHTYSGEYRSLMVLLFDKIYLEGFGECLGMGRCGTCRIRVLESPHKLTSFDRNESATLSKIQQVGGEELRLSCQIAVDDNLNGAVIEIIEL